MRGLRSAREEPCPAESRRGHVWVRARLARVQPGPLDLVQEITCGQARSRIAAAGVKTVLTYMANGTPGPLWQSRFSRVARRMTSVVRTHLELCALGPWPSKTDCTLSYRRRCHKRPQVTGDAVGGCGRGTAPSTSAAIRVWGRRTESMACQATSSWLDAGYGRRTTPRLPVPLASFQMPPSPRCPGPDMRRQSSDPSATSDK